MAKNVFISALYALFYSNVTHTPAVNAIIFHCVVNGFLSQGRPNQLRRICKLGNCFWLRL